MSLSPVCVYSPTRVILKTKTKRTQIKTVTLFKTSIQNFFLKALFPDIFVSLHTVIITLFSLSRVEHIHSSLNSVASSLLLKTTKHSPTSGPWHLDLEKLSLKYPLSIQASVLISPHQRELLPMTIPCCQFLATLPLYFFSPQNLLAHRTLLIKTFDLVTGYCLSVPK